MVSRREFIIGSGVMAAAGCLPGQTEPAAMKAEKVKRRWFRTISYNVQDCRAKQVFDEDAEVVRIAREQMPRRIAMELALYDPDVITLSEAPLEDVIAQMADWLGMKYVFFPGNEEPDDNPGAMLVRGEVLESQNCPLAKGPRPKELFTRHWGRAVIRAGGEEVAVYSAHLWPYGEGVEGREVTEILAVMEQDRQRNRSILFQGDLNHTPAGAEYARWRGAGLIDAFATKGTGIEFTCCDPDTRATPVPKERIDYIWTFGPLAGRLENCRVLFERSFRSHPEDPMAFALSDHLPIMATFGSGI